MDVRAEQRRSIEEERKGQHLELRPLVTERDMLREIERLNRTLDKYREK